MILLISNIYRQKLGYNDFIIFLLHKIIFLNFFVKKINFKLNNIQHVRYIIKLIILKNKK